MDTNNPHNNNTYNISQNTTNSPYSFLQSILYLAIICVILWYIRYWYRTMTAIQSYITDPNTTNNQKTSAIQNLDTSHTHKYISGAKSTEIQQDREGFIDIANESYRTGPSNDGPFRDYSDYSPPSDVGNTTATTLEQKIPYLSRLNKNTTSIDDQDAGYANGLDASQFKLPPMTTQNTCPQRPYPIDRRDRNREQQLRMISEEIRDRKLLSEDAYRTKYAWHNITSHTLNLPPGFGKLTPRLTEDGSSYEYAYTGDIRDSQTRTSMDILADYPRQEWNCDRLYQRCSAPEHLLGNAPEYYRRIKANEDRRNAIEQVTQSIRAQTSPQVLPPVYPS